MTNTDPLVEALMEAVAMACQTAQQTADIGKPYTLNASGSGKDVEVRSLPHDLFGASAHQRLSHLTWKRHMEQVCAPIHDPLRALVEHISQAPAYKQMHLVPQISVFIRRGHACASISATHFGLVTETDTMEIFPRANPLWPVLCRIAAGVYGIGVESSRSYPVRTKPNTFARLVAARSAKEALAWACVVYSPHILAHPENVLEDGVDTRAIIADLIAENTPTSANLFDDSLQSLDQ